MAYREKKITKLYYSIGEVAKIFEVNASLIRFWEKEFNIIRPKKNKKGNRVFTNMDIENFKKIFFLVKEKGFTLDGAKKALKGENTEEVGLVSTEIDINKVKTKLQELKDKLLELEQNL